MTDGLAALMVAGIALVTPPAWLSLRLVRLPVRDPARVVAELRLVQASALVLVFLAGVSGGIAVASLQAPGAGLEIAIAMGFLAVAAVAAWREPPDALMWLSAAFLAHALLDVLHRPGLLEATAAGTFSRDCAIVNLMLAAVCYLPLVRRRE